MKKINRLYFIFSYLFFIYPPFLLGIVLIYTNNQGMAHVQSLVLNIVLLLVIALICVIKIKQGSLHIPNPLETKYLLFGFSGNVVMYFYTNQANLNMENFVNIYVTLLIVLFVYFLLISRQFKPLELWLILPLFLVFDYLVLGLRGCGWMSYYCTPVTDYDIVLKVLFLLIVFAVALYYIYNIILYRLFDIFKKINIFIVFYLSLTASFTSLFDFEELTLTIMILYPFFVIVDFVVKIVNKTYTHTILLFYIRTLVVFVIFFSLGITEFYTDQFYTEILSLLVFITYASLFIVILKYILKIDVKDENPFTMLKQSRFTPKYSRVTKEDLDELIEVFGILLPKSLDFTSDCYSIVCKVDNHIVGLICSSSYQTENTVKQPSSKINALFVDKDFQHKGIGSKLVDLVEDHCASTNQYQITIELDADQYEAIELFTKRKYTFIQDKEDPKHFHCGKTL